MNESTEEGKQLRMKVARATIAMHGVNKNTTADLGEKRGSYSYANIEAVLDTVKPALHNEQVSLNQPYQIIKSDPPVMAVDTILTDVETGEHIMFAGPGFPVKGDPQAAGGSITYFRRYALVSLFGLVVEDDDAQQATHAHRNPGNRTEAETEIRTIISQMNGDDKQAFVDDFKQRFGMGLSELPIGSHGSALNYTRKWVTPLNEQQTIEGDS